MIGQRRALGTRVDSHRNIVGASAAEKAGAKNVPLKQVIEEKKPVVLEPFVKPVVKPKPNEKSIQKQRVYGGRKCMVSEQLATDIDYYLHTNAKRQQLTKDFLKDAKIDGRMRGILLDWIMQIQAKFQLAPETFYLACYILDRVIVPLEVTKETFQLIGLACIFVASKFEEVLIPNVHDFVYMGGDFCDISTLFKAERDVLRSLRFELTFSYPNHYLRKMRLLMPNDNHAVVYELSKLLIDIVMLDYNLASWLPSEAAAAAYHLSYEIIKVPCPVELLESVGVSESNAATKSKLLLDSMLKFAGQSSKLKGLRLKHQGSAAMSLVDKHISSSQ